MHRARNEFCSCGSGKRYKHCCGAVIPIVATASDVRPDAPAVPRAAVGSATGAHGEISFEPEPSRDCGNCTACCDGWLTGSIRGHEMSVGVPCHFRGDGGCTIYEERPADPCRGFYCAWRLRGNPFPEQYRPDRLGVIIMAKPWRGRVAYYLHPAGRELDETLLEWMREHSTSTGTPFLFKVNGRHRGYGSPEFQQHLLDKAARGEPLLPGLNPGVGGPCKLLPLSSDLGAIQDTPR